MLVAGITPDMTGQAATARPYKQLHDIRFISSLKTTKTTINVFNCFTRNFHNYKIHKKP